jgi:hypothetical protein
MNKTCKHCHFFCTKCITDDLIKCRSASYDLRPGIEQLYSEIANTYQGSCFIEEYCCYFGKWHLPIKDKGFPSKEEKESLKEKQNNQCCENFMDYNPNSTLEYMVNEARRKDESNKIHAVNIHTGNNSQVIYATDNAIIHATQNNGLNTQELENILTDLLQKIPANITEQEKEQIDESIDVIRTEMQNAQPKKSVLRTTISAIQAIKESAEFAAVIISLVEFFKGFL